MIKRLIFVVILLLAACSTTQTESSANLSPDNKATPPPLEIKTSTPLPTLTPTHTPTMAPPVVLVPRYMLPSTSYLSSLLGAQCNYQSDSWDVDYAYKAVTCPDLEVLWLSIRFTTLENDQTAIDVFGEIPPGNYMMIEPGDNLSQYENLSLSGKVENSEYSYFLVYETERFLISAEVFFTEDTALSIEEFYLDNTEIVLQKTLEGMLEIIKFTETPPEATPMAVNQQNLYQQNSHWLITESEANELYQGASDMWGDPMDGTWLSLGFDVDSERGSICRKFSDRTNADAPLLRFFNCVYHVGSDYSLDKILEDRPGVVVLESDYGYPLNSLIYGRDPGGPISLNAFVLQGDYLFYVFLESRVKTGQTPESIFNEFNDKFIFNVLVKNLERFAPAEEKTLVFEELFIQSPDSEWSFIRFGNNQWNLTSQTGLLKTYLTQTSNVYEGGPDTLLLRWIENEDFEIITRVLFEPKRNFQRAGLVIYQNRDNYVALLRSYADVGDNPGNAIYFDHASPLAPSYDDSNYNNYSTQITSLNDVYLKLRREGSVYTGFYSIDGQTWIQIGEHISSIEPVSYGLLIGKSDTEIFALFDFFEMHNLE
jgi:hypothetical protein